MEDRGVTADFVKFAAAHGVLIRRLVSDGRIHRCGTAEHPKSSNGAYSYNGRSGFVQAWDQHDAIVPFKPDRLLTPSEALCFRRQIDRAREERELGYVEAAKRAIEILQRCRYDSHPYLVQKGFADARGLIDPSTVTFRVDDDVVEPHADCLVVPMRHYRTGDLQSVQWISATGRKKYLAGGKAWDACFSIGPMRAPTWLVEGYATGLTVAEALRALYRQDRVLVTFSAANLKNVASAVGGQRWIVADNDAPDKHGRQAGQEAARATGLPWVMPEAQDEDADDLRQRCGIRAVADLMRSLL